jgi:hypothetical protein
MRLFDLKPSKPIPPAWVEADVGSYLSWNMDFAAAAGGPAFGSMRRSTPGF